MGDLSGGTTELGGGVDFASEEAVRNRAIQEQIFGQIFPFGRRALRVGRQALRGQAPAFFRRGVRTPLAEAFAGARENLVDFFGQSGQGISGLAAGPLAESFEAESRAIGDAELQAILNSIGVGFQGANVLAGQQAVFDPARMLQLGLGGAAAQGPGIGQTALGALIGLLLKSAFGGGGGGE